MKKVAVFLVVFMIVLTSAVSTTAIEKYDSYEQKLLKQGYTEEDILNLNAVLFLSEENVRGLILQKYDELKDWKKVREYYGVSEEKYENYMIGKKMQQETLNSIPSYIFEEMEDRGWTRSEISNFVNRGNISEIDWDYAWKECKSGRTIEDVQKERMAVDKEISNLTTDFVWSEMSVQEFETKVGVILGKDVVRKTDNMISDAVAGAVETRERAYQRHKERSGISDEEIEYCKSHGMTNPMDIYQAKYISSGNNVPLENVVHTYLEVGSWSVTVIEVLNIPPEEYIKSLEETIENDPTGSDNKMTREMIQQIKDFYSLNNEGPKKDDNNKQDIDNKEIFNIDDYIVLMVGSSKSYVCGTQKQIDETNPDVSIFVENDRSYVPIRFLTENYGGNVEWIEETQTANLFFDDSRISLTIGEMEIYVGDEVVISDVAPVLKNGRTFLPLRACINALDKHVFYSNGLILISEFQSNLDEIEDCKLIDEIIGKYYK